MAKDNNPTCPKCGSYESGKSKNSDYCNSCRHEALIRICNERYSVVKK